MLYCLILSIVIGAAGIYYALKNYNFFKRHGIIHVPPIPIFGFMASNIFRRLSLNDSIQKLYNFNRDAKYFGFYFMTQPAILLRDPELIKDILVKSFDTFPNRSGMVEFNENFFANNLFSLQGLRWRDVRSILSPSFTSSKMKSMFVLMSECAVDFVRCLSTLSTNGSDIDIKDIFSKYTNDVIATCAFGIKIDSMRNPRNKFYIYGKEVTNFTGIRALKFLFIQNFPRFARILNVKLMSDDEINFFNDIIKSTIATRDAENITRPDMIQLMMDIRGKREAGRELSIDDMTAQAFIFFLGGYESTGTVMSFAAHEIAVNQDIQIKLRQEIDQVVKETAGVVTYEIINRLEYLDAVINETLRLYPPVAMLERLCDQTYELPAACPGEKPFTMQKGMVLWIPVYGIQRDKKHYDNPEKFSPERFLNDKTQHNSPYYLPFGIGPRMCIANRFALLEMKVLLFHLLAKCELKPCARTTIPMKFSKKGIMTRPENGFWLNVQCRNDIQAEILSEHNE